MKYIKTYEKKLEIGDYVVIKRFSDIVKGKFAGYNTGNLNETFPYMVKLEDSENFPVSKEEILFNSLDENDCDVFLSSKKYNL